MTFYRVFKSAAFSAFLLALAFLGLSTLAQLPLKVAATGLSTNNFTVFTVAVWAWAGMAASTGAFLGMAHTFDKTDEAGRAAFLSAVELTLLAWVAFFFAHLTTLMLVSVHGGLTMAVAAFSVGLLLACLWRFSCLANLYVARSNLEGTGLAPLNRTC